jgi:hypothetical protein
VKGERQRVELADHPLAQLVLHREARVPAPDAHHTLQRGTRDLERGKRGQTRGEPGQAGRRAQTIEQILEQQRIQRAGGGEQQGEGNHRRQAAAVRPGELE